MSAIGWAELDALADALRTAGRDDVADALRDARAGAATGSEAIERLAMALDAHDAARRVLAADGQRAWDAVMRDLNRGYPIRALQYWLRRRFSR